MSVFLDVLDSHRRRFRVLRAGEAALRGAFWVSLAAGAALLGSRILGAPLGGVAALGAPALVAAGLALRELLRSYSRRDCAVELDRSLGLDERVATALEGAGALRELQAADAEAALARARIPAWRAPREASWLAGSLLVVVALSAAPALERRGDAGEARLEAAARQEAAKIEALAPDRVEFREVADALREGKIEAALERLQALRAALAASPAGTDARLEEALGEAARGLGAELGRAGRSVRAPAPAAADARLRRLLEGPATAVAGEPPPERRAAVLASKDWDPRYDAVVLSYFRGKP